MKNDYVWYACYGSNICLEKFLCYIDGKERIICDTRIKNEGCTNQQYPIDNKPYNFEYNVYFANKSVRWNNQGVAFLDISKSGSSYGRIYKITEEQFSQIRNQEGLGLNWYGFPEKDFGDPIDEVDGVKVYTFTQKNNKTQRNKPSEEYKNIIIKGLEEIGLSEKEAREYISKCENH